MLPGRKHFGRAFAAKQAGAAVRHGVTNHYAGRGLLANARGVGKRHPYKTGAAALMLCIAFEIGGCAVWAAEQPR